MSFHDEEHHGLNTIEQALSQIAAGGMVVVVDDEHRENEGDLVMAAQFADPAAVNFMISHARGLICVPLPSQRLSELDLGPMTGNNTARLGTRFTVSVDAHEQTTTGISASDRAATIQALANRHTRPEQLARPGHIFPLQANDLGVLGRPGHTEAGVDLCRLAGLEPAAVICEILSADGTMARLPELRQFAQRHQLPIVSIQSLISHRLKHELLVEEKADVGFPTIHGDFRLKLFHWTPDGKEHLALVKGEVAQRADVLIRVHSSCLTGDVLGSCRCDCGAQLEAALHEIEDAGSGVLLYLLQEGRGIGLANKILAYALQDAGRDTVEANTELGFSADLRDYAVAAQILRKLDVRSVRIMTNNPDKVNSLIEYGIHVSERVPLQVRLNRHNERYMRVKAEKMGHLLNLRKP